MAHDQEDPTCVIKILNDFRAGCNPSNSRGLSGGPKQNFPFRFNSLPSDSVQGSSKPLKLNFDESEITDSFGIFKKRKFDSTNESIDSEGQKTVGEISIVASPWENRRIQGELVEARAEIAALESRVKQLYALKRETEVMYEAEKADITQSLARERKNVKELEQRLKTVRKREADVREELNLLKTTLNQKVFSLEERCQFLEQENAQLNDRVYELESEAVETNGESGRQTSILENEIKTLKLEAEKNKQVFDELTVELKEKKRELRQWEMDKTMLLVAQQRIKDLEFEKETYQEAATLAKAQQEKLLRIPDLEKEINSLQQENRKLRETIGNKLYVENMVESLKAKVALTDSYEQELIHLRGEKERLNLQLDAWKNLSKLFVTDDKSDTSNPVLLRHLIKKLQQQEILLTSEKAKLQSRCDVLEKAKALILSDLRANKEEVVKLKDSVEQLSAGLKRMKKQLTLITWERNDLRNLVDSCQKEYSMIAHTTLDSQNMNKLESLEKIIDGYRQRMEVFEKDPSLAHTDITGSASGSPLSGNYEKVQAERDSLLKERENLIKVEEQLRVEKQRLESQIEELKTQMEYRALKGDFDVRETKVLHLRMNPTSTATATLNDKLNECRLENDKLKERVRVLEEGNNQDVTRIVEERVQTSSSKEVEELKERVRLSELQNQRLREVFKVKSQEYREAVYILFGYKVDGLPNKVYRLSSLYAEGPEDYLIFQESESGNMDMLETPFSQTLENLIDLHLTQQHSLPVFLSALTMSLFEKQNLTTTASAIVID